MNIRIKQPIVLNEAGGRELNEDFVFPLADQANPEERLFIVSDGEGGLNAGDVASKLLTLSMAKYFASTPPTGKIDQEYLNHALRTAEDSLTAYKDAHPDSKHMAASMAMVHLGDQQITFAWIGTSRPYYFDAKQGKLLSPAATIVGEDGLITGSDQPKQLHMSIVNVDDAHSGDYILLVTDGVLEHLEDRNIETMFQAPGMGDPEKVTTELNNLSQNYTKDNYSAYIIQLDAVKGAEKAAPAAVITEKKPKANKEEPVAASAPTPDPITDDQGFLDEVERSNRMARMITFGIMGVIVLGLIGWLVVSSLKSEFDKHLAAADLAVTEGNYEVASEEYESALMSTENMEEKAVIAERLRALNDQRAQQMSYLEMSPDSIESLREQALEMVENKNFNRAIQIYQELVNAAEERGDSTLDEFRVLLGETYLEEGNAQMTAGDKVKAKQAFRSGFEVLDGLKSERSELLLLAQRNYKTSQQETGEEPLQTNTRAIAQNTPQATNKRLANTPETRSTSTNASRREAKTSETGSLTATEEAALRKYLAEGKRKFTTAKTNDSESQYLQATTSLEQSGAMLDGSGAYLLATIFHEGRGGVKDETKALRYAQISARKGWPGGQYYYGHLLLFRQNPRDTVTAIQSMRQAANKNYPDAVNRLVQMGYSIQ